MYNDAFEQWFKTTKNMTSPLSGWGKTITDIYQRTLEQNVELMGEHFSRTSEQLKRLSHVKKPEDWFALQKECISENATAHIDTMQKVLQMTTKNIEELSHLCGTCQTQTTSAKQTKEYTK